MARVVNHVYNPILTLVVNTILEDGSIITRKIKEGDIVEGLRYVKNGEVISVTGRVSAISYQYKAVNRTYYDISKLRSYFKEDVVATSITVDASSEYQSNLINIPCREIVEDVNQENVVRMRYYLTYAVSGEITLSNESVCEFTMAEGDDVSDIVYLKNGTEPSIDARYVATQYNRFLVPTQFIFLSGSTIYRISANLIKSVGAVVEPADDDLVISDLIASADDNGIVSLANGMFTEQVDVTKDVLIKGTQAGLPATDELVARINVQLRNNSTEEYESVVTGKFTCSNNELSLNIDGLTLKDGAFVNPTSIADVTVKNTRVLELNPTGAKGFAIQTFGANTGKVVIENNYFGKNNEDGETNKVYNLMELTGKLTDGSSISNNYFEKGCSSHNDINIYEVEDGATINIKNNIWEYSANGIRIGTKGDAHCTINIENNQYLGTDTEYPEYAGLVLIQPYAKSTTTMEHVVINLKGNKHRDKNQLFYLYAGGGDMQFDEYNVPTIIVDGTVVLEPKPRDPEPNNG